MRLPQELVDYVINFLHDDPRTLIQASRVQGMAWSHPLTFLQVFKDHPPKTSVLDPSHLPPLCRYVKTLHFTSPSDATDPSTALDCFERSEPHTLALRSCNLRDLGEQTVRRCFARFPCTSITTLELHEISLTHGTLLVLLSLFPNVDNFTISPNHRWEYGPRNDDDDRILQHVSPSPIRGSFKFLDPPGLGYWSFNRGQLLPTLTTLPLQFQTVSWTSMNNPQRRSRPSLTRAPRL
jgi:hypothetical protein